MEAADIKNKIRGFILKEYLYEDYALKDDELLFNSGIIDSLGMIKLLTYLEETFGVNINLSEITMDNFNTVSKITDIITDKLKGNG